MEAYHLQQSWLEEMYKRTAKRAGLVHAVVGPTFSFAYKVQLEPLGLRNAHAAVKSDTELRDAAHGLLHGLDALHSASSFPDCFPALDYPALRVPVCKPPITCVACARCDLMSRSFGQPCKFSLGGQFQHCDAGRVCASRYGLAQHSMRHQQGALLSLGSGAGSTSRSGTSIPSHKLELQYAGGRPLQDRLGSAHAGADAARVCVCGDNPCSHGLCHLPREAC